MFLCCTSARSTSITSGTPKNSSKDKTTSRKQPTIHPRHLVPLFLWMGSIKGIGGLLIRRANAGCGVGLAGGAVGLGIVALRCVGMRVTNGAAAGGATGTVVFTGSATGSVCGFDGSDCFEGSWGGSAGGSGCFAAILLFSISASLTTPSASAHDSTAHIDASAVRAK